MGEQSTTAAPTGMVAVVGALIQHSETWGKVWFGLIFWGSVLFAVGQRIWPDANTALVLVISLLLGLCSGVAAHARGYWL
ncbi:MAG: hypothetical protein AAF567_08910 [Actinomycetota bacterium]